MRMKIFAEKTLVLAVAIALTVLSLIMIEQLGDRIGYLIPMVIVSAVVIEIFGFYVKSVRRDREEKE